MLETLKPVSWDGVAVRKNLSYYTVAKKKKKVNNFKKVRKEGRKGEGGGRLEGRKEGAKKK